MHWRILSILFTLFYSQSFAATTDSLLVGVHTNTNIRAIQIHPETDGYILFGDGKRITEFDSQDRFSLIKSSGFVQVKSQTKQLGKYREIELRATLDTAFFRMYIISPYQDQKVYDDNLIVRAKPSSLLLINKVELEKYVAGVVEAETGSNKPLEFYKVQAIISRSYALNNLNRFRSKGYNLNDLVDCQVYHGKARWEPAIKTAVELTKSMVLVDSEMRMITAAFHSNSGGETVSSEVVWTGNLSYLSQREDKFSLNGAHARWTKTISQSSWLAYLKNNYAFDITDRLLVEMATNYSQENRHVYFIDPLFEIPLKDIRKDWALNSTYFNIERTENDSLLFTGKGFGHGTGLSQEGAMRMADLGFSYIDILHFYYNDVHIIDLNAIDFFRTD